MRTAVRKSCLPCLCLSLLIALIGRATAQSTNSAQPNWCGLQAAYGNYHSRIEPPSNFLMKPQTATILVTYTGFPAPAESAFAFTARIWASTLISSVPIRINARFEPLPGGVLGVTFPNVPDTLFNGRWLTSALADAITGRDLNPGQFDIDLHLNSAFAAWYFGTDGNPPSNKYDFVTVVLHEMCHGLGFATTCKVQSGSGSYGLLSQSDFPGLVFSFPWPNFSRRQDLFVRYVENAAGQRLTDTTLFANPSTALAAQFTSNGVFFNGPNAVLANNGIRPKLYAPATFSLGSSILHLDQNTYPPGNINSLMTPFAFPGISNHSPGPIILGTYKDFGWRIDSTVVGIAEKMVDVPDVFRLEQNYPNPFNPSTKIQFALPRESVVRLIVYDVLGREVMKVVDEIRSAGYHTVEWNGENTSGSRVSSGVYFFRIETKDVAGQVPFMSVKRMMLLK